MSSGNWIIDNIANALETWNEKMAEILNLIVQSPETFKGGGIWNTITNINGALQAIGYALLVLFFLTGVVKTCTNFSELKRPEQAVKLFIRFAVAKIIISYGMELLSALFKIVQGVVSTILSAGGGAVDTPITMPDEMVTAVKELSFLESIPVWAVSLLGSLVVIVLSFIMLMSVYGRFFRLYLYTALSPVPLSTIAGEPTQNIGFSFLKGYAAVCLESAVIVLACIIFSSFAASPPAIAPDSTPVKLVWAYLGELIFNLLVLTGSVKMADRVIRELMGL